MGVIYIVNVLIVEDEEITREGLKKFINWQKFNCKLIGTAEDAFEGLYLIEKFKPEIIITDIVMSGISGLEMIRRIKNKNQKSKIIIITAYRNLSYAQEAVKLGAFRLLFKPIKIEELEESIKEALEDMDMELYLKEEEFYEFIINQLKAVTHRDNFSFLIRKIIEYIVQNYNKNLTLNDLSEQFFISYWHLSKLIKKELNINFNQLLNMVRIEKAKIFLRMPRYKISEIAELVGYNDVTYFCKVFKKLTGKSPYEYRNEKVI